MTKTELNFLSFAGIKIVSKALRMPCMTIARNAGIDASVVVSKVEELAQDLGYDALNNEYVNMIEKGIIDPTKVYCNTFYFEVIKVKHILFYKNFRFKP